MAPSHLEVLTTYVTTRPPLREPKVVFSRSFETRRGERHWNGIHGEVHPQGLDIGTIPLTLTIDILKVTQDNQKDYLLALHSPTPWETEIVSQSSHSLETLNCTPVRTLPDSGN